jgi:hypothetical protein
MTAPEWSYDDEALEAMIKAAVLEAGSIENRGIEDRAIDNRAIETGANAGDGPALPADACERMMRAARSAYIWRTVDAELEHLSVASDTVPEAAVRSHVRSRIVRFRGKNVTLEVEIGDDVIVGQVYPTQSGLVTLSPASGPATEVSTDGMGCFTIERPTDGPFRLRCDTPDSSVVTDWIT